MTINVISIFLGLLLVPSVSAMTSGASTAARSASRYLTRPAATTAAQARTYHFRPEFAQETLINYPEANISIKEARTIAAEAIARPTDIDGLKRADDILEKATIIHNDADEFATTWSKVKRTLHAEDLRRKMIQDINMQNRAMGDW